MRLRVIKDLCSLNLGGGGGGETEQIQYSFDCKKNWTIFKPELAKCSFIRVHLTTILYTAQRSLWLVVGKRWSPSAFQFFELFLHSKNTSTFSCTCSSTFHPLLYISTTCLYPHFIHYYILACFIHYYILPLYSLKIYHFLSHLVQTISVELSW